MQYDTSDTQWAAHAQFTIVPVRASCAFWAKPSMFKWRRTSLSVVRTNTAGHTEDGVGNISWP